MNELGWSGFSRNVHENPQGVAEPVKQSRAQDFVIGKREQSRLHQLADSSVNYAVRVWVRQEDYWDVYWDITRAVKIRFDEAGIKIPYPQRELHVTGSRDGMDDG